MSENANGLLHEFFPKGYDFTEALEGIMNALYLIHNRPRKCLDWKTAHEAFMESLEKQEARWQLAELAIGRTINDAAVPDQRRGTAAIEIKAINGAVALK